MNRVDEIMSTDVLCVEPTTPVLDVLRLMSRASVRHVPVVDPDGEMVGFISDRDVQTFGGSGAMSNAAMLDWFNSPASEVMSVEVLSVAPTTSLDEASGRLIEAKIGALPVIDGGKVVGILSVIDLLKWSRGLMRSASC